MCQTPRLISTASVVLMLPINVPALPERGAMTQARSSSVAIGGGFIVAAAARSQGTAVALASPLGTGPNSAVVRHALDEAGVTVLVEELVGDTGMCLALIEADGHITSVMAAGVEAEPQADALARIELNSGDWVFVAGQDLAYETSREVIVDWVRTLGPQIKLAFSVGPAIKEIPLDILLQVLPRCDLVTMNIREDEILRAMLGGVGHGDSSEVIRPHLKENCILVRRQGVEGAIVQENAASTARIYRSIAVPIVDTTGVGDTHTGVLLSALISGSSLPQALHRANAAAAIAITKVGSVAPTPQEIDELLG